MVRSRAVALLVLLAAMQPLPALAAATATARIADDDDDASGPKPVYSITLGATVTLAVTVTGAAVAHAPALPAVSGLTVSGSGASPGNHSVEFDYFITATRAGDLVIPAFDVHTADHQTLHVGPVRLHVQKG